MMQIEQCVDCGLCKTRCPYELDIPTLFADTVRTNVRSQHVLEKAGFTLIREDPDFLYYRIDRT